MKLEKFVFKGFEENEHSKTTITLNGKVYKGRWIYGFPVVYNSETIKLVIPEKRNDLMKLSECSYGIYQVIPESIIEVSEIK